MTATTTEIRLTEYANCAGCAAKMGAVDLAGVLAALAPHADPRLLVGHETFDDAAVFRVTDDVTLVQTVDFFAPIVDDPFEFGAVAAANALSDVYAMGGEPLTALAIAAFPAGTLPPTVLSEIVRGGQSKVHEARAVLVGGHTIIDTEVKFGLAVTGRVDPQRLLTNASAAPGDVLVLTKPLGTGVLATQAKRGTLGFTENRDLIRSMMALNATASRAALEGGVSCATDVTGFGLLGHALHIARASGVTLRFTARDLPRLPGVDDAIARGVSTGGADRNAQFVDGQVEWRTRDANVRAIVLDPQTSGGLLVAVAPARADEYVARVLGAAKVGVVEARGTFPLVVE